MAVAPVRPSAKHRYPLTPIERYVAWRREDGWLLDPWMRVRERLGARVSTPLPRSMRVTGTVADRERWTGLALPDSGDYVFPDGLDVLHVARDRDRGSTGSPTCGWSSPPSGDPAQSPTASATSGSTRCGIWVASAITVEERTMPGSESTASMTRCRSALDRATTRAHMSPTPVIV